MAVLGETADVACGSCTKCCTGNAVYMFPEFGDHPEFYDTVAAFNPITGRMGAMLDHRADGSCGYLTAKGCGIWAVRPAVCRGFDCADAYAKLKRPEKHRMKREGRWTPMWQEGERRYRLIDNGKRVY